MQETRLHQWKPIEGKTVSSLSLLARCTNQRLETVQCATDDASQIAKICSKRNSTIARLFKSARGTVSIRKILYNMSLVQNPNGLCRLCTEKDKKDNMNVIDGITSHASN